NMTAALDDRASWPAWWFLSLPIGMSVTAFGLAEPLLITAILATLVARRAGSSWTYVFAGCASVTRYHAAGLIVGNLLADWLPIRRPAGASSPDFAVRADVPTTITHPRRTALIRASLSSFPLAIWLVLTWATWATHSEGHYLHQIAERAT